MTDREIITGLLDKLENGNIVAVYEFAREHADRLGIALPDDWVLTAERDAMEERATKGGWLNDVQPGQEDYIL